MSSSSQPRRLAAVAFFDIVGYSAKMARSESEALACVRHFEELLRREVPASGGRVVKFLGDGSMAEFPTAIAAVECSQRALEAIAATADPRYEVRIGIHLGEVVDEAGDLFGDAVNIAARVQPLADPGGIALSEPVHTQLRNQVTLPGAFLPPQKLKNIPERMRIFLVPPKGGRSQSLRTGRRRFALRAGATGAGVLALAGGAWGLARVLRKPNSMGLLLVRELPRGDPEAKSVAEELLRRADSKLSGIPDLRWISHAGMLDLFARLGIRAEEIDRMEQMSCSAAREGGLSYSLVCDVGRTAEGPWRADARIICTRQTSVVASFSTDGENAEALAAGLRAQIEEWVDREL